MSTYDPFDPKVGTQIYSPNFFYLVRHPKGNVLFDTGIRPDYLDEAESVNSMEIEFRPEHHTDVQLAAIGLQPSDIDQVVMSHLHWDHAGGLKYFQHADVHVHERELEFAFDPAVYQAVYYDRRDFDLPLKWSKLSGEHDVFGDGRVIVYFAPGHTPGHQILFVEMESRSVLLLADAAFEIEKMRQRVLPPIIWSPDALVATWDRVEELERAKGAEVICAHELEYMTKLKVAPESWYE
jgi:glyoxylase-like metal-dependent hydrolase (beta-lactamase superfamily II)